MSTSKHILSKSTFMYGCQCTKRLFLHKFQPENRNPFDEQQMLLFSSGTNVGILAQELFPGGLNAEPPNPYSYHISVAKTKEFIEKGQEIIYEAAFVFDGVLCAIDILVKRNGKWYAYEVKSSTKVKSTYIEDASLQYYVINQAGIEIEDIFIVHVNNTYVRNGDLKVHELFFIQSIKSEVLNKSSESIAEKITELKAMLKEGIEPIIAPDDHCFIPYECDFTQHCWKEIIVPEKKKAEKFIDEPYLNKFISDLKYPLYFFDFETFMSPVPEFDFSRPYQQLPFQYSLHIQKTKNGDLEHREFLGDGENDPRVSLIKALIADLSKEGSILVWNQTFEITRLKELSRDFPQFTYEINLILERIVDLMVPFRNKSVVFPEFMNSYSIKKVLPVLVPELSYDDLEIKEGGTASMIYSNLKKEDKKDREEIRKHLLAYCHLDTLAMVKILTKIEDIININ